MDDTEKNLRDEYRSAALKEDGDVELVEHNGRTYEVRAPTIDDSRRARKKETKKEKTREGVVEETDGFRVTARLMIACTFIPGTETRVFEETDLDALLKRRAGKGSLIGKLLGAIKRLEEIPDEEDMEEAEKN